VLGAATAAAGCALPTVSMHQSGYLEVQSCILNVVKVASAICCLHITDLGHDQLCTPRLHANSMSSYKPQRCLKHAL
jgi:hypothetical protein